jgi:homoaconitase/3-isopropylmalate dehydratase large subunit
MTESKTKSVVIFYSTSGAIKTESLAKKQGLIVKLIPVPRHLSSDCGICLSFNSGDIQKIEKILSDNKIEFDDIYDL